jgi:hypothetical protein
MLIFVPPSETAEVYTGVLYDALDLPALHRRGITTDHVLVAAVTTAIGVGSTVFTVTATVMTRSIRQLRERLSRR